MSGLMEPFLRVSSESDAEIAKYAKSACGQTRISEMFNKGSLKSPVKTNSLMVLDKSATGSTLLAMEAFGTKIAKDKYLVSASTRILTAIARNSPSSPVEIPEDTSMELIETMAALWDPESSGALKDASKALSVAKNIITQVI